MCVSVSDSFIYSSACVGVWLIGCELATFLSASSWENTHIQKPGNNCRKKTIRQRGSKPHLLLSGPLCNRTAVIKLNSQVAARGGVKEDRELKRKADRQRGRREAGRKEMEADQRTSTHAHAHTQSGKIYSSCGKSARFSHR